MLGSTCSSIISYALYELSDRKHIFFRISTLYANDINAVEMVKSRRGKGSGTVGRVQLVG